MKMMVSMLAALVAGVSLGAVVVLPKASTAVERTAAKELSEGLERVTGAACPIVSEEPQSGLRYLVGGDPLAEAPWKPDEIRLVRQGDRVILTGHPTRGALYAVCEYLERVVGVRWWTKTETDWPKAPNFAPPAKLDIRYAPPFAIRETLYLDALSDARFKVHMKCNASSRTRYIIAPTTEQFVPPEAGGDMRLFFFAGRRSSYHSFFEVLPPKVWFAQHPEWYSFNRKLGQRTYKEGQLCVTDEGMAAEYIRQTLKLLREHPDCNAIQVSQNDSRVPCECPKCLAAMEKEGAWSGPYLAFANKVAEAVEKEFPNVLIDTFAYQFTRKAPKTVRPRHNVLVRLCDIECFFNHPLAASPADYAENANFMRDLADWSKVAAGRLFIWDYQANFTSYILPHPNMPVFADNLRTFRKYGTTGLFEQGDALCTVGDFCALKQYLTSHLMWNPDLDWRVLRDEFLNGYYGSAAAPHIRRALEAAEASVARAGVKGMRCYHPNVTDWIDVAAGKTALAEMAEARKVAQSAGEPYARRVRAAALSWEHAQILNWAQWGNGGSRAAAIRAWLAALKEYGIVAYCETTKREALDKYVEKLTREAAAETAGEGK